MFIFIKIYLSLGKTMESVRKRIDIELVSCDKRLQKLINMSTFKNYTYYSKNLAAITLERKVIKFDKPIYIGFSVLDISKTLMYNYHYNVIKSHYNDNATLMYTDTGMCYIIFTIYLAILYNINVLIFFPDSLVYNINTKDFYADLINSTDLFSQMDTADLPEEHPCFTDLRKKVPGYFSDEVKGDTILEFIALRAKSYSYKIDRVGKNIKIKAKGVRGHVVKNHMSFDDHKRCLFATNEEGCGIGFDPYKVNISIRSFKHNLKSIKTKKLAYNREDDKRIILDCQIHTSAYGRVGEICT